MNFLSKISKRTLYISAFVLVFTIGAYYYLHIVNSEGNSNVDKQNITYLCEEGKSFEVAIDGSTARIYLDNENDYSLKHVMSASGAKYANTDETIIFWSKGSEAFILENDERTYTECQS